MPVKGSYLAIAGAGGVLLWSGLRGKQWSDVIRQTIAGKKPEATTTAYPLSSNINTSPSGSVNTNVGGSAAKNQAIAKVLAVPFGWSTGQEWTDLVWLWNAESGWDNKARNPTSGAYGIPQALPPSKMGPLANPPLSAASAQITWGLGYIKTRYGSPSRAKAFHLANGWY